MRSAWALVDGLVAELAVLETARKSHSLVAERVYGDARQALSEAVSAVTARDRSPSSRHAALAALATARLAIETARELTSALEGSVARSHANLTRARVLVARSHFARGLLAAGLHVLMDEASLRDRNAVEQTARAVLSDRRPSELWLVAVMNRRGRSAVSVDGPDEWTAQRLKTAIRRTLGASSALSPPG